MNNNIQISALNKFNFWKIGIFAAIFRWNSRFNKKISFRVKNWYNIITKDMDFSSNFKNSKNFDFLLLLIIPVFSALVSLAIKANFLTSTLLFFWFAGSLAFL